MLKKYALNDEHEKRLERDGEDSGDCEDVFREHLLQWLPELTRQIHPCRSTRDQSMKCSGGWGCCRWDIFALQTQVCTLHSVDVELNEFHDLHDLEQCPIACTMRRRLEGQQCA